MNSNEKRINGIFAAIISLFLWVAIALIVGMMK